MKYVAFLDILGFKEKLKAMTHSEARQFIGHFSATAYAVWRDINPSYLKGYIVSDSFIIYSLDTSQEALIELVKVIDAICKAEFSRHSIILRGAISKGEFDKLEAREMHTLEKGLIVGQAYVDAYLLEGTVKTAGLVLTESVYHDLYNIERFNKDIFAETDAGTKHHILRYLTLDFLLEEKTIDKFIKLAKDSHWLPHFYNSLYLALRSETNDKKVHQVFFNIFDVISEGNPSANWQDVDLFIQNAFNENVFGNFKKRFLKYIRNHIF